MYKRHYFIVSKNTRTKQNKRRRVISKLGNIELTEESIEMFCVAMGIPELSETVYLFLNNKLEDTADILGVHESTITRRINKFLKD